MNAALIGPVLMLVGIGSLATMDALIKLLSAHYAVPVLVFYRMLFGIAFMLVQWPLWGWGALRTAHLRAHLLRGVVGTVLIGSFFLALSRSSMVEMYALFFTSPLMIVLLSIPLLGERPRGMQWLAVGLGLAGALVLLAPGQSEAPRDLVGSFAALVAAFCYALIIILLRRHGGRDSALATAFYGNLVPLAASSIPVMSIGLWPAPEHILLFVIVGFCGSMGLVCISAAVARTPASRLASLEYSGLLWGVFYGMLLFNEQPTLRMIMGAVLIITGGLLVMRSGERVEVHALDESD